MYSNCYQGNKGWWWSQGQETIHISRKGNETKQFCHKRMFTKGDSSLSYTMTPSSWEQHAVLLKNKQRTCEKQHIGILLLNIPWHQSTQTHVHWVSDAIQPSYPLLSPFLPAFNLSQLGRNRLKFTTSFYLLHPMECPYSYMPVKLLCISSN